MINKAKHLVENLMRNDDSGHGMEHINRVLELSMEFAGKESCNKEIVALAALLHDVDDYKLFGAKNQEELLNTKTILNELDIDENSKRQILEIVSSIGYSKCLKGKRPKTIEGMIVSDADMCDAIGANGILRVYQYELKNNKPFFDKTVWPIEGMDGTKYGKKVSETAVCHMFEKILKLKNLMMTNAGKQEAIERHNFVVNFLKQLFKEEKACEWAKYLDTYLSDEKTLSC